MRVHLNGTNRVVLKSAPNVSWPVTRDRAKLNQHITTQQGQQPKLIMCDMWWWGGLQTWASLSRSQRWPLHSATNTKDDLGLGPKFLICISPQKNCCPKVFLTKDFKRPERKRFILACQNKYAKQMHSTIMKISGNVGCESQKDKCYIKSSSKIFFLLLSYLRPESLFSVRWGCGDRLLLMVDGGHSPSELAGGGVQVRSPLPRWMPANCSHLLAQPQEGLPAVWRAKCVKVGNWLLLPAC